MWVSGIIALTKSKGDSESPWKIPLMILTSPSTSCAQVNSAIVSSNNLLISSFTPDPSNTLRATNGVTCRMPSGNRSTPLPNFSFSFALLSTPSYLYTASHTCPLMIIIMMIILILIIKSGKSSVSILDEHDFHFNIIHGLDNCFCFTLWDALMDAWLFTILLNLL